MSLYSRRNFLQLTGWTIASSGLILISPTAEALWFFGPVSGVVRFILSPKPKPKPKLVPKKVPGTIGKSGSPTRHSMPAGVGGSIESGASRNTFKSIANLGLTGSLVFSVSPTVYAQVQQYNAETIWVNTGVENNFILSLQNNSNVRKQAQLSYQLVDVPNEHVDLEKRCGLLSVGPRDTFGFSFGISDLPYTGVKRLKALTDCEDLHKVPSGNIVVANANEVAFNER